MGADVSELLALAADLSNAGASFETSVGGAVQSTTEALATEVAARAPKETGALAGSVEAFYAGSLFGQVYVNEHYWIFQEFGTAFMPAQPFINPSADGAEPKLAKAVEDALGDLLA